MPIILLSGDLTVRSRVEGAALRLSQAFHGAFSEAQAVEYCTSDDATTLVIDLSMSSLDVAALVNSLNDQNRSQTRIIAFGPHVHEARLAAAQAAGCDLVVSRGQFFSQLEAILSG